MDKNALKALMCEIPQFDRLSTDEIDSLSRYVEYVEMSAGSTMIREGTPGDSLFYIVDGLVEIKKESEDGQQVVVAHFKNGSSLGEIGLIEEKSKRSATAVVMQDSQFLTLSRESFLKIIDTEPKLAIKILLNITLSLASRLRYTSGRFADVFTK